MVEDNSEEAYLEQEQLEFYKKISGYISRHPEFVEDLQKKMDDEERLLASQTNANYSESNNYGKERNRGNESKTKKAKKSIFKLDDERINTIADELSGKFFDRDNSNKSVLETTLQDAFSSMVKNYLSKYAG